jgi:hypothetical protein
VGQTVHRKKKTDYGTVIFHWLLVALLALAVVTGLRIATETPDRTWIDVLDALLPKATVWTHHIDAAVLLIGIGIAYVVYVSRAGLGQRVRLDGVRLRGLFGRSTARWGTINIILYWVFYSAMLSQLVTGVMLYLGHVSHLTVLAHWFGLWALLGYGVLHVFSQWRLGGATQLLRILRPTRLPPPPLPFDPAAIFALLDAKANPPLAPDHERPVETFAKRPVSPPQSAATDEHRRRAVYSTHDDAPARDAQRHDAQRHDTPGHGAPGRDAERHGAQRHDAPERQHARDVRHDAQRDARHDRSPPTRRRRGPVIQANAFVVAIAAAVTGVAFMLAIERQTADTLTIHRIEPADRPVVDGESSDAIWQKIPPLSVVTERGGNFSGTGEATVSIKAVHDGVYAYFLFIWDDPTRSLKQLPLRKTAKGWELLHDGYEYGDERAFNEDKFSVLLTSLDATLAGDLTFHAGTEPAAGKPKTLSGRGLHYTSGEGAYVDVWQWKATSTNPSMYCDDNYIGPPAEAIKAQFDGMAPYRGGFAPDPGTANYQDNFAQRWPLGYLTNITPHRLPKDLGKTTAALGHLDLDPNHGESEGARWYMTEEESVPYSAELDRDIPEGTTVPGVIISGKYSGDRADVRCVGRWAAGRWALEVVRRLDVQSRYDVPIRTGTFMRVAAFDHAQIRHTRHVRPIRLEVK